MLIQFKNKKEFCFFVITTLFFLSSCKKEVREKKQALTGLVNIIEKKDCFISDKLELKGDQFRVVFDDFNLIFNNVMSIDNPDLDFDVKQKKGITYIYKKYLESDFFGDNEFLIQTSSLDSVNISCFVESDFIFYGQEKKRIPLNLSKTKEDIIFCKNGTFKLSKFKLADSSDVYKKAKEVNKKYFLSVLNSDFYGEVDKKEARESIKKIEENIQMSFEDLFIEESILSTTYKFDYYKNNKKNEQKLIIIKDEKTNKNTFEVGSIVYAQVETYLNIRSAPSSSGAIIAKAYPKDALKVLEVLEGWVKVDLNGTEGYVSSEFVK